ncbi:MAG TPA: hypothetical protein VN428_03385 [Bryobacteraceae bacterium]|nr:hypothetical protein [Bryobacteraceae bacterium]
MNGHTSLSESHSAIPVRPESVAPDAAGSAAVHHFSSPAKTPPALSASDGPQTTTASQASTAELQCRVATGLAQGMSVTSAARAAGVHRTAIHHWQRTSKEFCAAVEQARREFTESFADDLLDLAHSAVRTLQNLLSDPKTPPAVRLKAALAVLERPQFPNRGWNLPVRLETPRRQAALDGMAELEADYRIVRMTEAIRKHDESAAAETNPTVPRPLGSDGVEHYEPGAPSVAGRPTEPRASASGSAECCEPANSRREPRAQRARNALCPAVPARNISAAAEKTRRR